MPAKDKPLRAPCASGRVCPGFALVGKLTTAEAAAAAPAVAAPGDP